MPWNSAGTINLIPLEFAFFPETVIGDPAGDTLRLTHSGPFRYRSCLLRLYTTAGAGQTAILFSRRFWQTIEPQIIRVDYPRAFSESGVIFVAAARPWRWNAADPPWSITLEYFS